MNRATHMIISLILYLSLIAILKIQLDQWTLVGMTIAVIAGTTTPDILEHPKHFNHRSIWHSQTVLYFAILLLLLFDKTTMQFGFVFGYATHLMSDTYSRVGIPLWKVQCPECNGKLIKKEGEHGLFKGCERYPSCNYTENIY